MGDTDAVGSYHTGASPYGVLDMAGNVWEWVSDWYNTECYGASPAQNPQGPESGTYRVYRGGSWAGHTDPFVTRLSYRDGDYPVASYSQIGIRCARTP